MLSALNHLALKEESVFGTPVVPDVAYPIESEDIHEEGGIGIHGPVQANAAASIQPYAGRFTYPGTINTFIYPNEFGWFLKGWFGALPTSTNPEGSAWKHVFDVATGNLPSFTVEAYRQNETPRYAGIRLSSLAFNFASAEEVKVAIAVQGKSRAAQSAISPTWPTIRPFVAVDVSVFMAANKAGLDAAQADADVQNLTLTLNRNLEVLHGLNASQDPARIEPHRYKVNGSFDIYFADTTERAAFLARTQKALRIRCKGDLITGATYYQLDIDLVDIRFTAAPVGTTLDDIMMVACEFEAFYDTSNSEVIQATLYNATENYLNDVGS